MSKNVRRGFVVKDEIEFGNQWVDTLEQASEELCYLVNRNYPIKSASTFIGNHYLLSERQRLALVRMTSASWQLQKRKEKELSSNLLPSCLHIDGFNTIITLEVALSRSLLIKGMDGTLRDLAGLRGTYDIITQTEEAIKLILQTLRNLHVKEAKIYLDQPVSNSGRLKVLIMELAKSYPTQITVSVLSEVDRVLEQLPGVVSSDAIILDKCMSWFNLNQHIIEQYIPKAWIFTL